MKITKPRKVTKIPYTRKRKDIHEIEIVNLYRYKKY